MSFKTQKKITKLNLQNINNQKKKSKIRKLKIRITKDCSQNLLGEKVDELKL